MSVQKATSDNAKPQLQVHENPAPKGLIEIRKMFGDAKHMPGFVYSNLSEKERTALCFSAGFKRSDLGKEWDEFTADQRQALRKSLMLLSSVVKAFNEANALEPYKWLQGAQPNEPKYHDGNVVAPISKLHS